ncbi:hypothetical protein QQP08_019545 [Theobroma cacao]|nr:hypothetical protein QQP08_019545 [Theobroma cacao]
MTVEEYTMEFEQLHMKCDVHEPEEQTVARYLGGLNVEIADVVQLQPYWNLNDVIRLALKCESMGAVEKKLKEMELEYVRAMVEEGGIYVEQLFFHDPDGFMIEICNCDNLPVIPLAGEMVRSCSRLNLQMLQHQQIQRVVQQ